MAEDVFDLLEVFFGVYAYGVVFRGFDVEGDVVFEEAELFKSLGLFKGAVREGGEALERGLAVGIEADVFPVVGRASVAVVGDGGSGKVEGPAVGGGDDFDGVGIVDVFRRARNFESGDLDVGLREGFEERGEVFGFEERLVALDVDVDAGVDELREGVDAVGSAGELG